MLLSAAIAQYKIDYPYQKIRTKSLPDSISLDDEASCFEQLANLLLPDGIISGLGIAVDGSNNLTVQPGVWQIQRLQYSTSTITTFALDAQDPTLSRYDVIYADAFNTLHLLSGDLSSSPVEPVIPDGTLKICSALITPTSVTINNPPPIDYVDTQTNQTVNGIKTFTSSPQVPDGVSGQDAVSFNQLSSFITSGNFNNGIGPTTGSNIGLGGSPLMQDTTLDLSGFTLKFTQGLQQAADYSSYYDVTDRAIIDAGYFRKNQWFRPFVTGQNYVVGDMVSQNGSLFYINTTITNASVNAFDVLRPTQTSTSNPDSANIAAYNAWLAASALYQTADDNLIWLEISITTTNNTTFPLFSYSATPFGEDWFEFSVGVDNNAFSGIGYHAKYKFTTSMVATSNTWYELLPTYKTHDFITRTSGRTHELHIDVAFNSTSNTFEFRARHKLLTGSAALQDYSIEFAKSGGRRFFTLGTLSPSNYWPVLNASINPNTQLANWKGTDAGTPAFINGATVGGGPRVSYAFLTSGLDNYTSDISGSFTALSKITKGYADSTYLSGASLAGYLLKAGGTMTGNLILNADPTANLGAATKQYVDNSIANSAVYFGPGTFIPGGPTFSDPVGTINNAYVFGDISALSITTTTGGANFNQTSFANIANFKYLGTTVAAINPGGAFYGSGISAATSTNDGRIVMDPTGTVISRNQADGIASLKIAQLNTSSTGDIAEFYNAYRSILNITFDGSLLQNGLSKSVASVAMAYNMVSGLKPTANGDVLVGVAINPTFGKSTIASLNTLVGGTGYPSGIHLSNVTGGTGRNAVVQATVSGGGVVTGVALIDGGINYTAGDTLNIVITVNGTPVGSGGTITVASNTSYTGLFNYSLSVLNGPSLFAASTSSYGSVIVPVGATYTGTTPGTIWQDGTHIYIYINGAVKQFSLI